MTIVMMIHLYPLSMKGNYLLTSHHVVGGKVTNQTLV